MKGRNKAAITLLALHLLLMVYSASGILSKTAAKSEAFSWPWLILMGGVFLILAVYAIGWQQIIKRLPLTTASANKAVTVVWGIVWGALFFDEAISLGKLLGAALIIGGVVLFVKADEEEAWGEK